MYLARTVQLAFIAIVALLTGCAGGPTVKMTATDRAAIKTVTMNAPPTLPAEMAFSGRAQSFAAVGGVIGAALAANLADEPKAQLLQTMKANGINLPSILKTEFLATAKSRGLLAHAESSAVANGDLTLTVNVYGFGQTQGFSSLLYPLINVTATIKKPNGEIAWQRTDFAAPLNSENKYGYEFEQYIKEPELLRKTLTNISGIVSRMLLDSFSSGG